MTVENMRLHVMAAYPGPSWKYKVTRMKDSQVIAIFRNLMERNAKAKQKPQPKQEKSPEEEYHQMTLFELFEGEN